MAKSPCCFSGLDSYLQGSDSLLSSMLVSWLLGSCLQLCSSSGSHSCHTRQDGKTISREVQWWLQSIIVQLGLKLSLEVEPHVQWVGQVILHHDVLELYELTWCRGHYQAGYPPSHFQLASCGSCIDLRAWLNHRYQLDLVADPGTRLPESTSPGTLTSCFCRV